MSTETTPQPQGQALTLRNRETFAAIGRVQTEALALLGADTVSDLEKGYVAACAVQQLKDALTDNVMRPIAALQGSPLGFKTDRDRDGGYAIEVVRDCAITALLTGLRFHGNEWNIIGGNCYVTVNGCDRLFNSICAVPPVHSFGIVQFNEAEKRATIEYQVSYRLKGSTETATVKQTVAVRLQYDRNGRLVTTDDAVIGKARRKVLWSILRSIKGVELGEGEAEATPAEPRNVTPPKASAPASLDDALPAQPAPAAAPDNATRNETTPDTPPAAPAPEPKSEPAALEELDDYSKLEIAMDRDGVPLAGLLEYCKRAGFAPRAANSIREIKADQVGKILNGWKTVANIAKGYRS